MVKRKIDNRIRVLMENGMILGHRTMVVVVGDKSRDQVVYLHHMLSKSSLHRASVLWCYKKELTFSSHRRKRLKQVKAKIRSGQAELNEDDPFEMFVSTTDIRYCFYKETHKILGNTYKMCILQDFEAVTPNTLCRTIETVEGGGLVVVLLQSVASLRQLYTLSMDVHARYRTAAHQHVVPRFNERFILSLASCPACVVVDDQLRVLPISSHLRDLQPVPPPSSTDPLPPQEQELHALKESLKDSPPVGLLVDLCKTLDQAKVVLQFVVAITEKTLRTTVALTAARGRGKSAALGLAMAGAVAFGYCNIFVTSPSPENLNTLFEFVMRGLDALGYEQHLHYQFMRSADPQLNKCVVRVLINRERRQIIQYIAPHESQCLGQAELVVVDEAAAIPLPLIRAMLGPHLLFLSSTVSGYEGTGRSLSLKLIQQLRTQAKACIVKDDNVNNKSNNSNNINSSSVDKLSKTSELGRVLHEVSLEESIRYKSGDPVEAWLNRLLCLEATPQPLLSSLPPPANCQLYYVNRDTLFGYHKASERFLRQVVGLLVSSHYRNTPDDIQTLSDAPAHHLFVLLPPQDNVREDILPTVLVVLQVSLEGRISKSLVLSTMSQGERPAGDLIPWTVTNQFQNYDFPQLSGARVVRIATHPDIQGKGYGSRAMELLTEYYSAAASHADLSDELIPEQQLDTLVQDSQVGLLEEKLGPNPHSVPLLQLIHSRPPEALHYLGVAYGASQQLLNFWKRAGFTPVYLSQVSNSSTGEHTMVMLKVLGEAKEARSHSWLGNLWLDFRRRAVTLLGGPFRTYDCKMALTLLTNNVYKKNEEVLGSVELELHLSDQDLQRLEQFVQHQCEAAMIHDLLPSLARLYFLRRNKDFKLKPLKAAILCGVGVQRKATQEVAAELDVTHGLVLGQMHSLIVELTKQMKMWQEAEQTPVAADGVEEERVIELALIMQESVQKIKAKEEEEREKVTQLLDVTQFGIKAKEQENKEMLPSKKKIKLVKEERKKMKHQ